MSEPTTAQFWANEYLAEEAGRVALRGSGIVNIDMVIAAFAAGQAENEARRSEVPKPIKADAWWAQYRVRMNPDHGDVGWVALDAFLAGQAAGQAENAASHSASPTLLDIAKRLRDEFPGVTVCFNMEAWAYKSGAPNCHVKMWTYGTGTIEGCTSLDNAIARLKQARDGDANPANLPGADMQIDLTAEVT